MIVKTFVDPYYLCNRCNINSLTPNRRIPCGRGANCESEYKGHTKTTTELYEHDIRVEENPLESGGNGTEKH